MEHHCPSVVCLILQLILTFLTPSSPQHSFPWLDPYSPSLCQQPQPHSVHVVCRLPSGTFTSPLLPCSLPRALSVRPLGIRVLTFWRRWIFRVLSILTFEIYAAAAKSLQSCSTLCDPIDDSPPGSTIPGILQARTLKWVAISFSNAWKWKWSHSVMSDSLEPHGLQPTRLLCPWDFLGKGTGVGCLAFSVWDLYTILKGKGSVTYFGTRNVALSSNNKKAKIEPSRVPSVLPYIPMVG